MKKQLQIIGLITTLGLFAILVNGCAKDLLNNDLNGTSSLISASNYDVMTWDNTNFGSAIVINDEDSDRTNSSSNGVIKLSSHTHTPPYGMIFNWTMHKTHDDHRGYLKIDARIFEEFESFTVTTQQSNVYRDFVITPGNIEPIGNYYLFFLSRVANQDNPNSVNNVWIGSWVPKQTEECDDCDEPCVGDDCDPKDPEYREIGKPITVEVRPITDSIGCFITTYIVSRPNHSLNAIEVASVTTDYDGCDGEFAPNIKEFWNTIARSGRATSRIFNITTPDGLAPTWIWSKEDSWINDAERDQIRVLVAEINIGDTANIVENYIDLHFVTSNTAVVYVNGQQVSMGLTSNLSGKPIPSNPIDGFPKLCASAFSGNETAQLRLLTVDIKPYLISGTNQIEILAVKSGNCYSNCCDVEENTRYNDCNNPASIIFSAMFTEKTVGCDEDPEDPCEELMEGLKTEIQKTFDQYISLFHAQQTHDLATYINWAIDALIDEHPELEDCRDQLIITFVTKAKIQQGSKTRTVNSSNVRSRSIIR
jgi:hypothetical protein